MKPDVIKDLESVIHTGLERAPGGEAFVFFRADDIAVPSGRTFKLYDMFRRFRIPLALAVVPAWLSGPRWEQMKSVTKKDSSLWCWHQHGWRHTNHEPVGKKQEFGPSRKPEDIKSELSKGRRKLERLLGDDFFPVFTPPWNRCGLITLELLADLGYHAVSRHHNVQPPCPDTLPDLFVNVDLHTRKEPGPEGRWAGILNDLAQSMAGGWCGIMIHHRCMDDEAFVRLQALLETLKSFKNLYFVGFADLIKYNESGKPDDTNRFDCRCAP